MRSQAAVTFCQFLRPDLDFPSLPLDDCANNKIPQLLPLSDGWLPNIVFQNHTRTFVSSVKARYTYVHTFQDG